MPRAPAASLRSQKLGFRPALRRRNQASGLTALELEHDRRCGPAARAIALRLGRAALRLFDGRLRRAEVISLQLPRRQSLQLLELRHKRLAERERRLGHR